jgi:hypothetical protein
MVLTRGIPSTSRYSELSPWKTLGALIPLPTFIVIFVSPAGPGEGWRR